MWKKETTIVCENQNKIICVVRQVTQLANCALARGRQNVLVDLAGDAVVLQVKPAVNEKCIVRLAKEFVLSDLLKLKQR